MYKLIYTILFLLLIIHNCNADSKHIYSIGYVPICYHPGNDSDYNDSTNGLFLSYDKWMVGTFTNSLYNQSFFIGRRFSTKYIYLFDKYIYGRANLYAGGLVGYGDRMINIAGIAPMAAPTIEIGHSNFSVEIMANMAVISCMFKYTFEK